MTFEVEQKFPLDNHARLSAKIGELGGHFDPPISQVDTYYTHPSRDFAQTDEALRIRHSGTQWFVTYKGPKLDASTKTRREIELPLPSVGEQSGEFAEMLELLGFRPLATVHKTRRPARLAWRQWTVHLALDEVEGVGTFVELEVSATQEQLDAARGIIQSLADELGLADCERRAYLELLLLRPQS